MLVKIYVFKILNFKATKSIGTLFETHYLQDNAMLLLFPYCLLTWVTRVVSLQFFMYTTKKKKSKKEGPCLSVPSTIPFSSENKKPRWNELYFMLKLRYLTSI